MKNEKIPEGISNLGETGVESIRINGLKVEGLPLGQGNEAVAQLPMARAAARLTKIANIRARYPKASVVYLESRVKECRENIDRIQTFKADTEKMIGEYKGHISLCAYRDKQIKIIDTDTLLNENAKEEKRKVLCCDFPPYDVVAMEQQVLQSTESLQKADGVISQEHDSIAEHNTIIMQCQQRDAELKALGV